MDPTHRRLESIRWGLWVSLLLSIPITSFPFFPLPQGFVEALVRPLGLYPLGALVLLEVLVPGRPRRRWPRLFGPLLGFACVATAVTAVALLDPAMPLREQTPISRAIRAEITLAIGLGFLFMTWRMASTGERIQNSVRWLMVGLAISVGWGLLQGSRLLFRWPYYAPLNAIQRLISVRDMNPYRVSGLSYEPSWFADQLAVLFLPLLVASLISGAGTMIRRKGGWIVEAVLLGAGMISLALTYSRGGALTFAASTAIGLGVAALARWIRSRRRPRREIRTQAPPGKGRRRRARAGLALLVGLPVLVILAVIASRNEYFSLLWQTLGKLESLPSYFLALGVSTRSALAVAAWGVFRARPLIGVGLGQSGFYLFDHMPDWALDRNPEMAFMLAPSSWTFPNPKNLWARLLAETGLAGSVFFAIFLLLLLAGSLTLLFGRTSLTRRIGLYGLLCGPAVLLSGMSLDSFALPTMWIALGIVAAGISVLASQADSRRPEPPAGVPATIP